MITIPYNIVTTLKISTWLKSQGLKHERDYTWATDSINQVIRVSCRDTKWETLILLKSQFNE